MCKNQDLCKQIRKISACIFAFVLASTVAFIGPSAIASENKPVAVIDWAKGAAQETDATCGVMRFEHMTNHQVYTLWVKGKAAATCSFQAEGLTFAYPPNFGTTTQGTKTLFSFGRFGSDVVVAWSPGY